MRRLLLWLLLAACEGAAPIGTRGLDAGTPLPPPDGAPSRCDIADDCRDSNPCSAEACENARCVYRAVADGVACDDGLACTVADTCLAGTCDGAPRDCSALAGSCGIPICREGSGCEVELRPDGSMCDDGFACTDGDACFAGLCAGIARDCSPLDGPCAVGGCDEPGGACAAQPRGDGLPCDDGASCTVDDVCHGVGCAGTPLDCSNLDDDCQRGTCREPFAACVALPVNQGQPCDDGLFCTVGERCSAGVCAGSPRVCTVPGVGCAVGTCDEATSSCVVVVVGEGDGCDDGDFCTTGEICTTGVCTGGGPTTCDDGSDCTADACDSAAHCAHVPTNEGGTCDDGLFCTEGETCSAGACASGNPLDCDDADACTGDTCDETSAACVNAFLGPFPGLEGPDGDPTCTDALDNDCDRHIDGDDGSCVPGNPGVLCGVDYCVDPEVCCIADQPDPYCTTTCGGFPVDCDGPEDCPEDICCMEVITDGGSQGVVSDARTYCTDSCPYRCDSDVFRSETCVSTAGCSATEPHCCTVPESGSAAGFCLDPLCAAALQGLTNAMCDPDPP